MATKKTTTAEAIWVESQQRWTIKVQKDGVRKFFSSSVPGRKGKHIAENKADEWLESDSTEQTFDQAWKIFIAYHDKNSSRSYRDKFESHGRLYLLPTLGRKRLSAITPIMWQSCLNAAAEHGLSKRSVENLRATIMSFLKFSRKSRWAFDPLFDGDLTIPKTAAPKKEKQVLQPDAIRMLFDDPRIDYKGKLKLSPYSYAWQFIVATGLRRGELCGLKNEDIDGNTVHVRRSINYLSEETTGKNDNARRSFELTSVAMAVLDRQRDMLKECGIISPWVFPDQYGERANPNYLYDSWRTWCRQHDLKLSIHELRHTYISIGKADLPIELMKATVGHSSNMDTYGVYGHEVDGEKHRAAVIMDGVFDRILDCKE